MASLQKLAIPGVKDDVPKPDMDELLPGIEVGMQNNSFNWLLLNGMF